MPVLMWFLRYWHFSASNFSSFLFLSIRLCYALHRPKIVLILSPRVSSDINKREFCISSSGSVLKFHKLLNKTLHKIKVLHLHVSSIIFTCFVSYLHVRPRYTWKSTFYMGFFPRVNQRRKTSLIYKYWSLINLTPVNCHNASPNPNPNAIVGAKILLL